MLKVFITRKLPPIAKEMLRGKGFSVEENTGLALGREQLGRVLKDYDVILSTLADKIDRGLLQGAKAKVISNCAIGLDNIDTEYAREKGIAVFNTPDIVTDSTADLAMSLLLGFCRRICPASRYVKEGRWKGWDPELFVGEELQGKVLGIIGFGRIGKAVAKRALSFGLKVVFYQKRPLPEEEKVDKCEPVGFDELLGISDYISLHVPLKADTRKMIDLKNFRKMKKKPLVLNLARGAVIDTEALIAALQEKLIRGAALDVTDPEPPAKGHLLLSFDNCLIVPHIGTATEECRFSMAKKAAENILGFFNF